jgi:hypothetical protein
VARQPNSGLGDLIFEVSHTIRPSRPIGLLWRSDQLVAEAATYTKQSYKHTHTKQTNIHAVIEFRSRNPSSEAGSYPHLIPNGHCDRRINTLRHRNLSSFQVNFTFVMWSVIITDQEALRRAILIAVRTLSVIHKEKSNKIYQNFIIPYLYETQHVSGDTPPIIRGLNLHWQPLVFQGWWTCSWWTLSGTLCLTKSTN